MEARWLIEAKFAPPARVRRQIERARILDRLQVTASRLTVVQAPAGFGKSTLLGQWASRLAGTGVAVAWLNLDEDDRQLDSFATYLGEAVGRALRPAAGPGMSIHSGLPARALLTALVAELERLPRPLTIVLDDYHRAESEEVDAALRLFLERAPASVRVALGTRALPRLGVPRLKAESRATLVGDGELRFSEGETSLFFAAEMPRLDHADWLRFAERAEGWPVALQFARMWLSDGGSLSALSAASEANDLGQYLSEQVFGTLTAEQRDFLLRTSPLEIISEEVAAEIGIARPALRVKELLRSALPLVVLAQEPLRFRYHHLFQDFLIGHARDREVDLFDIHRRAAGWFARSGDLASAVRHAIAGRDTAYAAAILERAGGWRLVYRGHGHLGSILRSVHDALDEAAATPPRLRLGAAVVAAKRGDLATASRLFDEAVVSGVGETQELADETSVIDALIKLYCDQPLPEPALARLVELVGRMDESDPMTVALGTNLVAYFTLQKGDFQRARRFGERAIRHFRKADAFFGELHLYAHIGQAELAAGDVAAAEAAYATMRDLCRQRLGAESDLDAIASVLAAETRFLADDRDAARLLLGPALARIEEADGWFDIFASAYLTAIRLELADHGPAAGYAAIERGRRTAERRRMHRLARLLDEDLVRAATLAGDVTRALAVCGQAGLSLLVADVPALAPPVSSLRGDGPAVTVARLLLRLDRPAEALAFLDAADRQSRTGGTPLSRRIVTRLLRASAEHRLGNRSQAVAILTTVTGLAGPEKLSRVLLDEGETFRDLAAEIAGDAGNGSLLGHRLRRILQPRSSEPAAQTPGDLALSGRERQILDLVAEGLTNKEIGRRIGVDPNTVKYHLKRLFAKLAVERRVSAVTRARNYGLIA